MREAEGELSVQDSARVPRAWKRNMRNEAEDTSGQGQSGHKDSSRTRLPLPGRTAPHLQRRTLEAGRLAERQVAISSDNS